MMNNNLYRTSKGFYLIEVLITISLFSLVVLGAYKVLKSDLSLRSLEMQAMDTAMKLNRFMRLLEEYIKTNTFNRDTEISCQALGLSSDICRDNFGNTFKGLIVLDRSGQIKNVAIIMDICTDDCPLADEFERLKYFNILASKLLTVSKGAYKLYYISDGKIYTPSNSYSDIKQGTNSENAQAYFNTNFNNAVKFAVARNLVDSLGWWIWKVELYYDRNSEEYSIKFYNEGYSSICPSGYKRPIQITDGQILNGGTVVNPNARNITDFPYDYLEGFCLPAPKEYVDINKTLPEMNRPISMSNYMVNTPCRSSYTPNQCCPVQNQPDYCVEVQANIANIPYWIYGFTSSARVNVAHYHIKVGSKYYQVFYMQPHWAYTYYNWWAQNTFGFVIESDENGKQFGFEFLQGPAYTLRPHVIRNIFWINGRFTLW